MSNQFVGAFDLSGFLAVPSSLKIEYQQAWNTYNSVQLFNSNISTLRHTPWASIYTYRGIRIQTGQLSQKIEA